MLMNTQQHKSHVIVSCLQFVDEACHQIERNERSVRQMGVFSYIPRYMLSTCFDNFEHVHIVKFLQ